MSIVDLPQTPTRDELEIALRALSGQFSLLMPRLIVRFDPVYFVHCDAISGLLQLEQRAQGLVNEFCRPSS